MKQATSTKRTLREHDIERYFGEKNIFLVGLLWKCTILFGNIHTKDGREDTTFSLYFLNLANIRLNIEEAPLKIKKSELYY